MPLITQSVFVEKAALLPLLLFRQLNDEEGGEDPFVKLFPLGSRDTWLGQWHQLDNPYGMTEQGAVGAAPVFAQMPGRKMYEAEPGAYREYTTLDEVELTKSTKPGTLADPIDVEERTAQVLLYFAERFGNRYFKMMADLGTTGKITNTDRAGNRHTYAIQNYQNINVSAWLSDPLNATPIDDLRSAQQTLNKGTSSRFGQKSKLAMADEGVSALLATAQVRNSFRSAYGASFMAPFDNAMRTGAQPAINGDQSLNKLFFGMGLPEIVPWNRGMYQTFADARDKTKANYLKFIGGTQAVWLGYRPNQQQAGQVALCRHASLEGPDSALYGIAPVKKPDGVSEFGKNLFLQVKYENAQPAHYHFEIGANVCPEVWYEDVMASVTWS